MIEPALTPGEWAKGVVVFKGRGTYDTYGIELVTPRNGQDDYLTVFDGSWAAPVRECHRMAAAALCLHGRITWEMVDALRDGAGRLESESERADEEMRSGDSLYHAMAAQPLREIADLLESLLPPRVQGWHAEHVAVVRDEVPSLDDLLTRVLPPHIVIEPKPMADVGVQIAVEQYRDMFLHRDQVTLHLDERGGLPEAVLALLRTRFCLSCGRPDPRCECGNDE